MKKIALLIVIVLLLIVGYQYRSSRLKSQLLEESTKPSEGTTVSTVCDTYSEDVANECYQKLALEKKDRSYCDLISKTSVKQECLRELEFLL